MPCRIMLGLAGHEYNQVRSSTRPEAELKQPWLWLKAARHLLGLDPPDFEVLSAKLFGVYTERVSPEGMLIPYYLGP